MNGTNPADSLFAACELANRALAGMYAAGASREALATLSELVADLKREHDQLPWTIHEQEASHCPDCQYGERDLHPALDPGDYHPSMYGWHCKAKREYQCPIVKGCGFHDPKDPMAGVPNFLKVQAS